jgi:hypothetical protein
MDDETGRAWEKTTAAYFKTLSLRLSSDTKETSQGTKTGQLASRPGFELGIPKDLREGNKQLYVDGSAVLIWT